MLVALHPAETALSLGDPERNPPANHALAAPALYVAKNAAQRPVQVLDAVGRRERATERLCDAEAKDGQGLVQPLAETLCGAVLAIRFKPACELNQLTLCRLRIPHLVCI